MSSSSPALARIASALALCMVAGVCLAGLLFPVIGGAALLGKSAADDFLALPSKLETPPLAQRSRILDRHGRVIATLFTENRVQVTLGQVPKHAQDALVAIEDSRFREHRGIDVKGTIRAIARNSSSGSVQQGGSTLTQQYVKNVLIESARTKAGQQAARERSVHRKLQEARYALALEETMTKDQILEGYLNIAYYGNGVYGIGTAAAHYWGVPVSKLTLAQGALLAGMVQNPRRYDPQANPRNSMARRNIVLRRMAELGYITQQQAVAASRSALGLRVTTVRSGCEAPGLKAPFFCDYVRRYLETGPAGAALGETRQERQEALLAGGLTIRTTLDPKAQKAAQDTVDKQVPRRDPSGVAAVVDVVEPGTGAVRAMAVNRGFGSRKGETKVNLAIGGSLGFQAGSTFKVFTLARAMQMGISPQLTLYAPQSYCPKAFDYKLLDGGCPGNAGDSESGRFTMVKATWESVNTYFLQLAERTGLDAPIGLAEAMGVRRVNGNLEGAPLKHEGSFVLGAPTVSPLSMAAAYATFAARGQYCPPNPIASITDSQGKDVSLPTSACSQVLEPENADAVTAILRGVIDGPEPLRTGKAASIGRPAAGKTGTTNESKAAWFVGYTPQLSTAVWVGNPRRPTPMRGITINGHRYRAVYGGSLPAPIWRDVMRGALRGVPAENFTAPTKLDSGTRVTVPDVRGLTTSAAVEQLRAAGFGVSVGSAVDSFAPRGVVVLTSPSAGARVPAGTTIRVYPSSGRAPAVPQPTAAPSPTRTKPGNGPPPPPPTSPAPSPQPSPTKKNDH